MIEAANTSVSPDRTFGQRARAVAPQALALAAILLLAVELRLIFSIGMVQLDSLSYVPSRRSFRDSGSSPRGVPA